MAILRFLIFFTYNLFNLKEEKTKTNLKENAKEKERKEKEIHYDIEDDQDEHPHKLFEPLPFYDYSLFEEKIGNFFK